MACSSDARTNFAYLPPSIATDIMTVQMVQTRRIAPESLVPTTNSCVPRVGRTAPPSVSQNRNCAITKGTVRTALTRSPPAVSHLPQPWIRIFNVCVVPLQQNWRVPPSVASTSVRRPSRAVLATVRREGSWRTITELAWTGTNALNGVSATNFAAILTVVMCVPARRATS